MTDLINGVPADRWGTWCPHGIRIVEPDPTDLNTEYPLGRIVDPWPCDKGCTREVFEQNLADDEADYQRDLWGTHRHLAG